MRYAVFADVHGNVEALDAVLTTLRTEPIDQCFCCGDIVGYGADPKACLELLRLLNTVFVAGNHDWVAAGRQEAENFNPWARAAVLWTRTRLNDADKKFLYDLPLTRIQDEFILVHGTLHEPENFYYLDGLLDAAMTFQLMDRPVCFVGHNHVPAIIVQGEQRKISYCVGYSAQQQDSCRYIINVGSVGQPRDGRPEAAFCIYDTGAKTIEIRRVAYAVRQAQEKIIAAGLPKPLATRLGLGF